jgi:hypothetical protein
MEDPKMDVKALAQKLGIDFTKLTPEETRQFSLNLKRMADQAKIVGKTHPRPEPFIGRDAAEDAARDAARKIAEETRERLRKQQTSPR